MDFSGVAWRKSSRSGDGDNSACVEIAFIPGSVWRKSSRSGDGGNSACVEIAFGSGAVGVRDSKHPEAGPLVFGRRAWETFLAKPA